MSDPRELPLLLVAALTRALGHRLRTPLSVIQNDLSYLATIVPPDECTRGIERCRQISEILRGATVRGGARIARARLDLTSLARAHGAASTESEVAIAGDGEKLDVVFAALPTVVREIVEDEVKAELRAPSPAEAVFVVSGSRKMPFLREGQWGSLSQLVLEGLERDLVTPILIDAIVWAHHGSVAASIEGARIECQLHFPRTEATPLT